MTELREDPAERAGRYISKFEEALQNSTILKEKGRVDGAAITRVTDAIHRYLQDARYYLENNRPTTSLASIAYAEGLLDALVFLDLAKSNQASKFSVSRS
jgi:hypothetical protein